MMEIGDLVTLVSALATIAFTGFVAFFAWRVAHHTKKYTDETRKLWRITMDSYLARIAANHLFEGYIDRIKKRPPYWESMVELFRALRKKGYEVFGEDCERAILEEVFPRIKEIEKKGLTKLREDGYEFREGSQEALQTKLKQEP